MLFSSFVVSVKIYSRITRNTYEAFGGLYDGMIKVEFTVQCYINWTLTENEENLILVFVNKNNREKANSYNNIIVCTQISLFISRKQVFIIFLKRYLLMKFRNFLN